MPLIGPGDEPRIVDSVVRSVETARLHTDPFDHFQLRNIFPPDIYQVMIDNYPDQRSKLDRLANPFATKYKPVKQFEFLPNSGYGFGVSQDSFHGREPIKRSDGVRNSILLFYLRDAVKLTY